MGSLGLLLSFSACAPLLPPKDTPSPFFCMDYYAILGSSLPFVLPPGIVEKTDIIRMRVEV